VSANQKQELPLIAIFYCHEETQIRT